MFLFRSTIATTAYIENNVVAGCDLVVILEAKIIMWLTAKETFSVVPLSATC